MRSSLQTSHKARLLAEKGQVLRQEFDYILFRNTSEGNRRRENERRNSTDRRHGERRGDAGRRNGTDRRQTLQERIQKLERVLTGIMIEQVALYSASQEIQGSKEEA